MAEKKDHYDIPLNTPPAYPAVTYVPVQQYPWMNGQPQPQMYIPRPVPIPVQNVVNVGINTPQGEEKVAFIPQSTPDRPFGTFLDFVGGLFFGLVFPVFSGLMSAVFETSQLSRLGVWYGHADFFLLLAVGTVHAIFQNHHAIGRHWWILLIVAAVFFIISIVLFVKAGCRTWRFMSAYESSTTKAPHEIVTVSSPHGVRRDYTISCVISFLFTFLGGLIRLRFNNSLLSRYGIVKGMAWNWIIFGGLMGLCASGSFLLFGLVMLQCANIHFRRAFICAGIPKENWAGCCSRRRCCKSNEQCSSA